MVAMSFKKVFWEFEVLVENLSLFMKMEMGSTMTRKAMNEDHGYLVTADRNMALVFRVRSTGRDS